MRAFSIFSVALFYISLHSSFAEASVSANETTMNTNSPWFFGGFSLAVADAQAYEDGGQGFFAYNYATVNYAVAPGQHFSFRIPFTYRTAGYDNFGERNLNQELLIDDLIVDFTKSATLLPFDTEVFSRIRYEAPTGKYSRLQKSIGSIRLDFIFSKHIARGFQMEYWPILKWNIHTQTVYENPDIDNNLSHTKRYEVDQRVNFWYVPNGKLAVGAFVGTEDVWLNESPANNTTRQREGRLAEHTIKVGPSVRYNLNESVRFLFSISNNVPLWGFNEDRTAATSDIGKFKTEHTDFALLTFLSF